MSERRGGKKEKRLPLVEIKKTDSMDKKVVIGRSIPDIPGIHNYKLIVYEGDIKRYIGAEKTQLIYIIVGIKEKSIQGKYIKRKRSVYISESIYIKFKKELDDFFSKPVIIL